MKQILFIFLIMYVPAQAMRLTLGHTTPEQEKFNRDEWLWDAARIANAAKVRRFLELGANPNYYRYGEGTPLHAMIFKYTESPALSVDCFQILSALMEAGAWINAQTPDGQTPLMIATALANTDPKRSALLVIELLAVGADPSYEDAREQTASDRLLRRSPEIDRVGQLLMDAAANIERENGLQPMDTRD